MMAGFFLALSFAAMTSMISTVELCVRNFVDHGYDREKSVALISVLASVLVRYSIRHHVDSNSTVKVLPSLNSWKSKTTFGAMA